MPIINVFVALGLGATTLVGLDAASPYVNLERVAQQWDMSTPNACLERDCSYPNIAGTGYSFRIRKGRLTAYEAGKKISREKLVRSGDTILMSCLSPRGNQLAVVIQWAKTTVRGRMGSAPIHPGQRVRQNRFEIWNPVSAKMVRSLALGDFRPRALSLTDYGVYLLLYGEDTARFRYQVRIYNCRSGKLEHEIDVFKTNDVVLAANGFSDGCQKWQLKPATLEGKTLLWGQDVGSIAQFTVGCPRSLSLAAFKGQPLAVIGISGAAKSLNNILSAKLTVMLNGAGFEVVERERFYEVLEELMIQFNGLTNPEDTAAIGQLANAHFLVFGSLGKAGRSSSLSLRIVSVETAKVRISCELTCVNCREQDYPDGLGRLVENWIGK